MVSKLVFIGVLAVLWLNTTSERRTVQGKVFYGTTTKEHAQRLYTLTEKLDKLIAELTRLQTSNSRPDIARLLQKYRSITFAELADTTETVAYNENKRHIYLCLKNATDDGLMYVAIHELAHCATEKYDPQNGKGVTVHGPEFVEVCEYMYGVAEPLGLLNLKTVKNDQYCDTDL